MKIIGVDRKRSSDELGEAERYLKIEGVGNVNAPEYFKALHDAYESPIKREAVLSGMNIIVTCRLDELQDQIDILNPICAEVAKKIQQHIEDVKRKVEEERKAQQAAIKAADDIYRSLKFN